MEDDDDAFLYGESSAPAATLVAQGTDTLVDKASQDAADATSKTNNVEKNGTANSKGDQQDEDDDKEEEEDDEDDDDDDSESDIEFIIDSNQEAPPAPRPFQRPGMPGFRPGSTHSTPQRAQLTEYTPRSRPQALLASPVNPVPVNFSAAATLTSPSKPPSTGLENAKQSTEGSVPEGPPPPAPSTAPTLRLSPGPQDRIFPPPENPADDPQDGQDLFDIDIDALDDKPWRRPGADLTDYFNYGFNEESWSMWRGKKESITAIRKEIEARSHNQEKESSVATESGPRDNELPHDMHAMMSMMPPGMQLPPQQIQAMQAAMMGQQGGMMGQQAGMMGMPGMGPDQMMAMMGMSGMPNMSMGMMGGMFGAAPNGIGGFGQQQQPLVQQPPQRPLMQFGHITPVIPVTPVAPIAPVTSVTSVTPTTNHPGHQTADHDRARSSTPKPQTGGDIQDESSSKQENRVSKPEESSTTAADVANETVATPSEGTANTPPAAAGFKMEGMSEADMNAFFGASGVDMSQVAAVGFPVMPGVPTGPSGRGGSPALRGGAAGRGASSAGRSSRGGRGGPPKGAPTGPSASSGRATSPLPSNVPTGPRNPGKRYNDRDTGGGIADTLDYGGGGGATKSNVDDESPSDRPRRSRESSVRENERDRDRSFSKRTSSHRERDRRDRERTGESDTESRSRSSRRRKEETPRSEDETASQESGNARKKRTKAEKEREREREREARSQARAERRAGRDVIDSTTNGGGGGSSSRKRSAPDDLESNNSSDKEVATSRRSSRKKR